MHTFWRWIDMCPLMCLQLLDMSRGLPVSLFFFFWVRHCFPSNIVFFFKKKNIFKDLNTFFIQKIKLDSSNQKLSRIFLWGTVPLSFIIFICHYHVICFCFVALHFIISNAMGWHFVPLTLHIVKHELCNCFSPGTKKTRDLQNSGLRGYKHLRRWSQTFRSLYVDGYHTSF